MKEADCSEGLQVVGRDTAARGQEVEGEMAQVRAVVAREADRVALEAAVVTVAMAVVVRMESVAEGLVAVVEDVLVADRAAVASRVAAREAALSGRARAAIEAREGVGWEMATTAVAARATVDQARAIVVSVEVVEMVLVRVAVVWMAMAAKVEVEVEVTLATATAGEGVAAKEAKLAAMWVAAEMQVVPTEGAMAVVWAAIEEAAASVVWWAGAVGVASTVEAVWAVASMGEERSAAALEVRREDAQDTAAAATRVAPRVAALVAVSMVASIHIAGHHNPHSRFLPDTQPTQSQDRHHRSSHHWPSPTGRCNGCYRRSQEESRAARTAVGAAVAAEVTMGRAVVQVVAAAACRQLAGD